MVKAPRAPEEVVNIPEEPKTVREIHIPEWRTQAAAAEVRKVDGKWKAVRLDGRPLWSDKFGPPTV
ncbi:MAG TPA: hypothetical protein VMH91_03245 [Candidatus Paceibacterota bacterium]|nr:hypothetical protein [Candidatus Paceibacterota bacterium]